MTQADFLLRFDQLLELDPGTTTGNERLSGVKAWDSLAVMGFIAFLDQEFGISVPASDILACTTPNDLARLAGGRIT